MTEIRRTLARRPHTPWSIVLALTVAVSLFVTAGATVRGAAHPSMVPLPTIRLGYFEVGGGLLPRFLDPALISGATDGDTTALYLAGPLYIGTDDKVHLGLIQRSTVSKSGTC